MIRCFCFMVSNWHFAFRVNFWLIPTRNLKKSNIHWKFRIDWKWMKSFDPKTKPYKLGQSGHGAYQIIQNSRYYFGYGPSRQKSRYDFKRSCQDPGSLVKATRVQSKMPVLFQVSNIQFLDLKYLSMLVYWLWMILITFLTFYE